MIRITCIVAWSALAMFFIFARPAAAETKAAGLAKAPKSRVFRLNYGGVLNKLPAGARVRVWLPVPQTNEHQTIKVLASDLPAESVVSIEPTYGNKILYFETKGPPSSKGASGSLAFTISYQVSRREVCGLAGNGENTEVRNGLLNEQRRNLFLSANKKTPLEGKHIALLEGVRFPPDAMAVARVLYDRVDEHVRYDKSRPGYGNGDALWVCDSRFGNCTDFHSLFISWARAKGLPARFEIGFPLPPTRGQGKIGGYHCWAWFHRSKKGWTPVDISEADKHPQLKEYYFGNLTENRVAFTTGRDIELRPKQNGEPLNFFIYPYVEVDAQAWPQAKIELAFSYADLDKKHAAE